MAIKPGTLPAPKQTRFNPTAVAILGSMVVAIVLTTLMVGSPFRAVRNAYATLDGQERRPVPTQPSPNEGNQPKESSVTK